MRKEMSEADNACPFRAAELVTYSPSDHDRGNLVMTEYVDLKRGGTYRITRIDKDFYLVLEGFEKTACGGLFWTLFSKVAV
jgi:hypothetical protein